MSARSVRGSSYSRIHGYLKDDLEPPPEFLDEAARLLGVRRAWLVDGQGEPTVAEEVLERTAREDRNEPVATEIEALIAREFMSYHRLPAAARALVWEAFQSHNGHALSVAIWSGEAKLSHRAIAQRMGRALAAPLDAMGLDPDRLPARQLGEFVEEMCQALKTLVPEPFTRGPMPTLAVENDAAWLPSSERVTPHREVAGRPAP